VRLNAVITVTSTWLVHKIFTYMDITQLKLIKLTCKDIHVMAIYVSALL